MDVSAVEFERIKYYCLDGKAERKIQESMFQGGIHIRTVKKGHMRVKGAGELERDTMHCAEEFSCM